MVMMRQELTFSKQISLTQQVDDDDDEDDDDDNDDDDDVDVQMDFTTCQMVSKEMGQASVMAT